MTEPSPQPPPLNEHGLLPPGVHDMTLAEVRERFGRFQRTDRRPGLFEKLEAFVKEVQFASPDIRVLVDGSFIMGKVDEPGDVDIILVLPADWIFQEDAPPYQYNVMSKRMVRRRFGFDMLVARAGRESEAEAIAFFAQVSAKWLDRLGISAGTTKGLVRITP